jgi:hypothetical protein
MSLSFAWRRAWVKVSESQARSHPLYGVNSPLFWFYMLTLTAFLVRLATLYMAMDVIEPRDLAVAHICRVLLAGSLGLPLLLLALSITWHSMVPFALIACLWALVAADAGLLLLGVATDMSFLVMAVSLVVAPLFTYYLLLSRRVNVTYRNRMRHGDPVLDGSGEN